ncbi:MAG: hypothetical protein JW987_13960 [Anaerolineaceae bacterium]|nr:hypothetical protein [Anaerolineaceae bacterium]
MIPKCLTGNGHSGMLRQALLRNQSIIHEDLRLPVLALEYEYRAYLQMGRLEKAEQIRRRLESR